MSITNTISLLNNVYKGVSNLTITDKISGIVRNFSPPSSVSLEDGTEERDIVTRSQVGTMARANTVAVSEMPMLMVSYGAFKAEKFITSTGYNTTTGSFNMKYIKSLIVPTDGATDAVSSGEYGFEVAEDAVAVASYTDNDNSVALTQVNYASFVSATDDTFAVGASGEFLWSDNLAAVNAIVTVEVEMTTSGSGFSATPFGEVEVNFSVVDSFNKITLVRIPSARIDTSGKSFNPDNESIEINFKIFTPPGECRAYEIVDTNATVSC